MTVKAHLDKLLAALDAEKKEWEKLEAQVSGKCATFKRILRQLPFARFTKVKELLPVAQAVKQAVVSSAEAHGEDVKVTTAAKRHLNGSGKTVQETADPAEFRKKYY